ncbi:hypothetical protein BGW80DRAFT_1247138 [Lactifluus volemus]|nr:hypothetical protein BGW80DRAFT_1247138 [Lactifluus volemus]
MSLSVKPPLPESNLRETKRTETDNALQTAFIRSVASVSPSAAPPHRSMATTTHGTDSGENESHSNDTRPRRLLPSIPNADLTKKPGPDVALQPGAEDQHGHDGDDESEYDDHHEQNNSTTLHHPLPPPQPEKKKPTQSPPRPSDSTGTSPTPTSLTPLAHVRFHSRVRITGGLRRHHSRRLGGGVLGNDDSSSSSDSPSSSISAPLRYRSRETLPREPLSQRLSQLASQALKKRRVAVAAKKIGSVGAAAGKRRGSGSSNRWEEDDDERAPLARTGFSFAYGATVPTPAVAQGDESGNDIVVGENSSRNHRRGQDIGFGGWLSRAFNTRVSWTGCFLQQRSCS